MVKLQITLTDQEAGLLSAKAADLGYDVTKYAKFVLAKEAAEGLGGIPTFVGSKKLEKVVKQARNDFRVGDTVAWPVKEL